MDSSREKVDTTGGPDACWPWLASFFGGGYGQFSPDCVRKAAAHRVAYELLVGPIPEGLDLDHLCRNRACVNPAHLEPVTRRENLRRGDHNNRGKTHCKHGHEFTPENTYVKPAGNRQCRACGIERRRAYLQRKRAV